MKSREVDVFRGARTRHSREHAHPTLEQPLGLLAPGEDPGKESVVACLTDLSVDGGCADAGTSQPGCLLAASLMASSSERQSPYPSGSVTVPSLRSSASQLEQIVRQAEARALASGSNGGEVRHQLLRGKELVGANGITYAVGHE